MTGREKRQPRSILAPDATREALPDVHSRSLANAKNITVIIHAVIEPQTNTKPNRRRAMLIDVLTPDY